MISYTPRYTWEIDASGPNVRYTIRTKGRVYHVIGESAREVLGPGELARQFLVGSRP